MPHLTAALVRRSKLGKRLRRLLRAWKDKAEEVPDAPSTACRTEPPWLPTCQTLYDALRRIVAASPSLLPSSTAPASKQALITDVLSPLLLPRRRRAVIAVCAESDGGSDSGGAGSDADDADDGNDNGVGNENNDHARDGDDSPVAPLPARAPVP